MRHYEHREGVGFGPHETGGSFRASDSAASPARNKVISPNRENTAPTTHPRIRSINTQDAAPSTAPHHTPNDGGNATREADERITADISEEKADPLKREGRQRFLEVRPIEYKRWGRKPILLAESVCFSRIVTSATSTTGIEDLGISHDTAARVEKAARVAQQFVEDDLVVDCYSFAALVCGGKFSPIPETDAAKLSFDYHFGDIEDATTVNESTLPTFQPLGIGTPAEDGSFAPDHVIVKVPLESHERPPLYVSKLGESGVVFTGLKGIVEYYEATHIAPFVKATVSRTDSRATVFDYQAPSQATS